MLLIIVGDRITVISDIRAILETSQTGKAVEAVPFGLEILRRTFVFEDPGLRTTVAGIVFPNPVCLVAGFDKNGRVVRFLSALGFGFIEIGAVSFDFSAGNPKPRLFRLPKDEAVVIHYGHPNEGAFRETGVPFRFVSGFVLKLPRGKPEGLRTPPLGVENPGRG